MTIDKEKLDKYYEAPEEDTLVIDLNPQYQVLEKQIETQEAVKNSIKEKFGEVSSVSNNSRLKDAYIGRANYKKVFNDFQKNSIDLWYTDPYYGRIDETGAIARIVPPVNTKAPVSGVGSRLAQEPTFILTALEEIKKEYSRKVKVRESTIKTLNVVRGWDNERDLQDQHLEELYQNFYNFVLDPLHNSNKIKNIDDFYSFLKDFIKQQNISFTTAGIMESLVNNPFTSGLVYDMFDGDPSSDAEKIEFYEDPNFKTYEYVITKHGFRIDPNIPWRIIADLSSSGLYAYIQQDYSRFKNVSFFDVQVNEIIDELYTPYASYMTVSSATSGFYKTVIRFYNRFIKENAIYNTVSKSASDFEHYKHIKNNYRKQSPMTWEIKEREPAPNPLGVFLNIDPKYLEWYLEIRNIERRSPLNNAQIKQIKRAIRQIHGRVSFAKHPFNRELANYSIGLVEYSLGSIKAVSVKTLTKKEKDITMVPKLSEYTGTF